MSAVEFIVIGFTFWFIVPTLVILGLLFYCAADDNPGMALVVTGIYIVLIQACSNFSFFSWISLNTKSFLTYLALFIVIGIVFAVVKFWFKLVEKRRAFDRAFETFLIEKGIKDKGYKYSNLPEEYQASCYSVVSRFSPPTLIESTKYITFWMAYWPIVGIWTLINNPLRWFWEEVKHKLANLFSDMHKQILGGRADELNKWRNTKYESNEKNKSTKPEDWKDS